jgi:hypothetical protein
MMPIADKPRPRQPGKPFYFNTSEHLLRIGRCAATTLPELLQAVKTCPDDSIFQHTFRTLQEHHFIRHGFSNDFAHWSLSACHEPVLAEQLASLDVREFTTIEALRQCMIEILDDFLQEHPRSGSHTASEPFYFCASDILVLPTPFVAGSLPAFLDGLRQVSIHSIQHHFIEARLRLHLMSNDFSQWVEEEIALPHVADSIERIDIYTNTMEGVRQQIARLIQPFVN